jgi:hypothetical protein
MPATRSRFFPLAHGLMLVVVVLGFAPTFFLRGMVPQPPVLDMPALPAHFILHGVLLLAWYTLLWLQPVLVQRQQLAVHRRLGLFAAGLAVAVLGSTVWMVLRMPPRMHTLATTLGLPVEELEPGMNDILWMDLFMCLAFLGFVATGVLLRNRPMVHKRCMYFAGIAFLFAATARLGSAIAHVSGVEPLALLVHPGVLLGLSIGLLVHDKRTLGHVHHASWRCFGAYVAAVALSILLGALDSSAALEHLLVGL